MIWRILPPGDDRDTLVCRPSLPLSSPAGAPVQSLYHALALILLLLVLGTLGYMGLEGWGVLDSLWMVAITLATIGYAEVHPLSDPGRIFTLALIVGWFGLGTYALSSATQSLVDGTLVRAFRRRSKERIMRKLKNHYIVVGHGRLGRAVVDELLAMGEDICVVERDPDVVARLEAEDRVAVILGEGADDNALLGARIQRARGVAIALPSAAEAVYVSMAAKQLNPRLEIVTRVDGGEAGQRARRVGADQVVSPYRIGGWRMAHGLVRPAATSFIDLATMADNREINVDELLIPDGSPFAGNTLSQLQVGSSHGLLVVAIRKADGRMITTPGASQVIDAGDVMIVIGRPARLQQFCQALACSPDLD